jgi:hypothetical protein
MNNNEKHKPGPCIHTVTTERDALKATLKDIADAIEAYLAHGDVELMQWVIKARKAVGELPANYPDDPHSAFLAERALPQSIGAHRRAAIREIAGFDDVPAAQADRQFTVGSSHGELTIDANGNVIRLRVDNPGDKDGKHLTSILAFDLEEWKRFWKKDLPQHFDILGLGYWYSRAIGAPKFAGPDTAWRKDIVQELLKHEVGGK